MFSIHKMPAIERAPEYPKVETFQKDGRRPLHELYETYFSLLNEGWKLELICVQYEVQANGEILELPVYGFLSPKKTNAPEPTLWITNEIHGEEPGPPEASANSIDVIASLPDRGITVAAIFLPNPSGYHRDWRYFNQRRRPNFGHNFGKSVGDADHLLPKKLLPFLPKKFKPTNQYAEAIMKWILEKGREYEPFLSMDHHEDEFQKNIFFADWHSFYSYAYGDSKVLEIVCPMLVKVMERSGYSMQKQGRTRFFEKIENGFVKNSSDGSIDEFFTSDVYFDHGKRLPKKAAKAAFVLETIIHHKHPQPISERAKVHMDIIRAYPELWESLLGL